MKRIVGLAVAVGLLLAVAGCKVESVDAGQVGVIIKKPWLFGSGGVDTAPVPAGGVTLLALTSGFARYDVRPFRIDEHFTDLVTSDNAPVSFNAYIQVQVPGALAPVLHRDFGPGWYPANIQASFRTMVRDFARSHKMFELTTDPVVTTSGQLELQQSLKTLVERLKLPVVIDSIVIGSVNPPAEVLAETARTAAQQQRVKTEAARALAEVARKDAESNKARADRGYADAFGMDAREFLQYRSLEIQREMVEVVKDKPNVNVLVTSGGGTPALPTFATDRPK